MSSGNQSLAVTHRCLTTKCRGYLDPEYGPYGEWVYWHPEANGRGGWRASPPAGLTHDQVPLDQTPVHQ
jgi:hypothetical protein